MINKKKIAISAGSSIIQTVVSGITVFILFKYILKTIGPEKLGIWSLVLAASSMVQVANLGMSGSIVKNAATGYADPALAERLLGWKAQFARGKDVRRRLALACQEL